jgi:hypothetical protein
MKPHDEQAGGMCPDSNSNAFVQIFTKLGQKLYLDNIYVKYEYGSCQIKN